MQEVMKRLSILSNQVVYMGMVLSTMPIGDYDRRVVLLTKECGKISAFAKGARRPNSALLACSQPFTFGYFTLIEGRSSYNMVSAQIENYFTELRDDLDAVAMGMYFCEFADYYGRENMEAMNMLKLLYQSLRALSKNTISKSLIRYIFEQKIMALNGEGPQVFSCLKCNEEVVCDKPYLLNVREGGILCENCKRQVPGGFYLQPATIYTLQYIASSSIEKLFTFRVSDEVLHELEKLNEQYMECYIDRKFRSLKMFEAF